MAAGADLSFGIQRTLRAIKQRLVIHIPVTNAQF